jgi:putative transposase
MLQRHSQTVFPGKIHFVGMTASEPGLWFTAPPLCKSLLESFEWHRNRFLIQCLGYVLMPDHLDVLLHDDSGGVAITELLHVFRKVSAQKFRPTTFTGLALWNTPFDVVAMTDTNAIIARLNQIHNHPLDRGLVALPEQYPWSSAAYYKLNTPGIVKVAKY